MLTIDKGKGVDARRKSYMRDHLTGSNIFPRLLRTVDTECHSLFTTVCAELRQVIDEETRNLSNDLHVIVAEEGELTEATRFPETASMLREELKRAERTLGMARGIVDELRSTSS